ncbi:MAG: Gfo/Idh/MocA family oxidoreductase [bacterium]|nr:Gfo/Idh/MocA family oxidoreductase [bacterium]
MVKVGMLSFAHMHANSYITCLKSLPNVEVVGIADDNSARGKKIAKLHQTKFFSSYEKLLDTDIHAVVICSENVNHKKLTVMAAKSGKHVLCEKPISVSVKDAQTMIDTCEKQGVQLMTAFPCRFAPAVVRVKQMIDEGRIGRILAINGTNHGRMPGGWFIDKKLSGGGAVMDHTVHVADLMRWFTKSEFIEVYAEIDTRFYNFTIDDCGILSLKMDNGIFATLDPSWSRPSVYPTWGDVTMHIIGTDGVIWLDTFNQKMALYNNDDVRPNWVYWGSNMDLEMIKSFIAAIEQNKPVPVTGYDGLKAMEVALGAYAAAKKKAPVKLPLEK